MKHLFRAALLGLLMLPFGQVFAAANSTLNINIAVSIESTVTIVWADDTTTMRTWTIGATATLDNTYDTIALTGNGNVFDVKNSSLVPVDIAIGVTNQGNWINRKFTGDYTGALDQYWIRISKNNTDFTAPIELPTVVDTTVALTTTPLARGLSQTVDLQFHTPVSVSIASGGTIVVRMTATAH